jgi:hypothetical protein
MPATARRTLTVATEEPLSGTDNGGRQTSDHVLLVSSRESKRMQLLHNVEVAPPGQPTQQKPQRQNLEDMEVRK